MSDNVREPAAAILVERAQTLHSAIAADLCPDGDCGHMRCRAGCGHAFPIGAASVAIYLRHGWPRCCGRQMRWERATATTAAGVPSAGGLP